MFDSAHIIISDFEMFQNFKGTGSLYWIVKVPKMIGSRSRTFSLAKVLNRVFMSHIIIFFEWLLLKIELWMFKLRFNSWIEHEHHWKNSSVTTDIASKSKIPWKKIFSLVEQVEPASSLIGYLVLNRKLERPELSFWI